MKRKKTINNVLVHIFLAVLAAIWVFPVLWVVMTSFQVTKGFFDTTPFAIDEAAMLDG